MNINEVITKLTEDAEYQKQFRAAMKKYGVKSPDELADDKKDDFFDYVDKMYKSAAEKETGMEDPKSESALREYIRKSILEILKEKNGDK